MQGSIKFQPLSEASGAEILDLDLRQPLSAEQQADLRALFDRYYLLLFRKQEISAEDQIRFVSTFGPVSDQMETGDFFTYVSNQAGGALGERMLPYHRDFDFVPYMPKAICLYGHQLEGGTIPTEYVDSVKAARSLPASLRHRLEGRTLVNRDYSAGFDEKGGLPYTELDRSPDENRYLSYEWPVLRPHPRTGELLISGTEMETSHIEGLSREESAATIRELFDYLYAPDNVYSHPWELGDLLIWDNHAMQHGRRQIDGFGPSSKRVLRRVVVCEKNFRELLRGTEHYRPGLVIPM